MKKPLLNRFVVCGKHNEETRSKKLPLPTGGTIVMASTKDSAICVAKALNNDLFQWPGKFVASLLNGLRGLNEESLETFGVAISILKSKKGLKIQYVLLDSNYNVLDVSTKRDKIMDEYKRRNLSVFIRDKYTCAPTLRFLPKWENSEVSLFDMQDGSIVYTEKAEPNLIAGANVLEKTPGTLLKLKSLSSSYANVLQ